MAEEPIGVGCTVDPAEPPCINPAGHDWACRTEEEAHVVVLRNTCKRCGLVCEERQEYCYDPVIRYLS